MHRVRYYIPWLDQYGCPWTLCEKHLWSWKGSTPDRFLCYVGESKFGHPLCHSCSEEEWRAFSDKWRDEFWEAFAANLWEKADGGIEVQ